MPRPFFTHLRGHELIERSKGYEAIVSIVGYWSAWCTIITCPVCKKRVADTHIGFKFANHENFLSHMDSHSKEERNLHAKEVSEMLRPYLSGKERWPCSVRKIGERLFGELEEAGVLPAEESE